MTRSTRVAASVAVALLALTLAACGSGPSVPAGMLLLQQSGTDAEPDIGQSSNAFTPQGNFSVEYDVQCSTDGRVATGSGLLTILGPNGEVGAIEAHRTWAPIAGAESAGTLLVRYSDLGDAKGSPVQVHIEPHTLGTSCNWNITVKTA
jgi:hypothetical protein